MWGFKKLTLQAQLRSSESDICKLKSVIKVASDAVRKAAEEKAYFCLLFFFLPFFAFFLLRKAAEEKAYLFTSVKVCGSLKTFVCV